MRNKMNIGYTSMTRGEGGFGERKRLENDKAHYEKSEKKQRGDYLDEKIKAKKMRDECKLRVFRSK